jgi:hypothetical protein
MTIDFVVAVGRRFDISWTPSGFELVCDPTFNEELEYPDTSSTLCV